MNNDCDPFQKFDEGLRNVNASALHIGLTVLDQMVDIRLSWIFLVSNGISSRSGLLDKLSAKDLEVMHQRWLVLLDQDSPQNLPFGIHVAILQDAVHSEI